MCQGYGEADQLGGDVPGSPHSNLAAAELEARYAELVDANPDDTSAGPQVRAQMHVQAIDLYNLHALLDLSGTLTLNAVHVIRRRNSGHCAGYLVDTDLSIAAAILVEDNVLSPCDFAGRRIR